MRLTDDLRAIGDAVTAGFVSRSVGQSSHWLLSLRDDLAHHELRHDGGDSSFCQRHEAWAPPRYPNQIGKGAAGNIEADRVCSY